jgi:PadR family transcriptional regulator PadR
VTTVPETKEKINDMKQDNTENIRSQMRKGLLEYCILSILSRGEAYVSTILKEMKAANMIVVEGTIYPLLIREKNQGLLSYRWEESTQGPPRKYYSITDKGREMLKEMDDSWQDLVNSISTIKNSKA